MAPGPDQHDIDVALEAMRSDAKTWSDAATTVDSVRAPARNVHLDAAQFSYFADKAGITRTYAELQQRVVTLLAQASANFSSISRTLHTCADDYERTEHQISGMMHGIHN